MVISRETTRDKRYSSRYRGVRRRAEAAPPVSVGQSDPPILRELVGVKAPGINTLWPQVQPLDTLVGKVPERRLRSAEVDGGPVVQLPGVPARGAVEESQPVEAGVGSDVRVVGSHQRDVQSPGAERSSPSENEG